MINSFSLISNFQSKDLVEDLLPRVANEFYSLIITFEFIDFNLFNALQSIRVIILFDVWIILNVASGNPFKLSL